MDTDKGPPDPTHDRPAIVEEPTEPTQDQALKWLPVALSIATIVATILTAVPAFLALTRDRPDVCYDVNVSSILSSSAEHQSRVAKIKDILRTNHIPDSILALDLLNTGDASAKTVKIGINVSGPISDVATDPAKRDLPIWVDLPDNLDSLAGNPTANIQLNNLAPNKTLRLNLGYMTTTTQQGPANVDVIFDGRQATLVEDISKCPKHTLLAELRLPLIIFVVGCALALVASFGMVLMRNKVFADVMANVLRETIRSVFPY